MCSTYTCNFRRKEKLDDKTLFILEAVALVHDCGIKPAEEKYGKCDGKMQEAEGSAAAKKLLFGFTEEDAKRLCDLVAHHHTYDNIEGADYQILVEADFLVNFYEDNLPKEKMAETVGKIFKTETAIKLAREMYSL
ncbi:MAG: phosphohydrolase [Phascolarctobacterium sp.]|nr:phosphohydrolase [Phascolarctobacterium sp.]